MISNVSLPADVRAAGTRRRQELQGRRRLRADARLPARQGDGRRHGPLAEGPFAPADAGHPFDRARQRPRAGPRPAALQGDAVLSTVLEAELLVHLDTQINSARHLLKLVLAQGAAIRERDTDAVLARLADIQSEMVRRGTLEQERTALLQRAGMALGVPATSVTLERLCQLVTPGRRPGRDGAFRRAARPAGRDRSRARHQPRADAPGAHLPLAPHPPDRQRGRAGLPPAGRQRRAGPTAPPVYRALDLQA